MSRLRLSAGTSAIDRASRRRVSVYACGRSFGLPPRIPPRHASYDGQWGLSGRIGERAWWLLLLTRGVAAPRSRRRRPGA